MKITQIKWNYFIIEAGPNCKNKNWDKKIEKFNKEEFTFYSESNYIGKAIKYTVKDCKNLELKNVILVDKDKIMKIYWENLKYSTENPDLFEKIPKEIVKLFKFGWLTSTKLRQYYDSILNLYNVYSKQKDFYPNKFKSDLNILIARVNYDTNRQWVKVPKDMVKFLEYNKDMIFKDENKVKDHFKIFKKHFETVVAYAKWQLKD